MTRPTCVIQAPAKVNLSLAVGPCEDTPIGPRHPVCTWIVRTDLADELTITALEPDYFSRYAVIWADDARHTAPIDWSIARDLTVRAHAALERHVGRRLPVQLKLEKRVPVGAGMGGGSSDAAAMLFGCNRLFDLGLTAHDLQGLAGELGSDVHFFLAGAASAVVSGFGERIDPCTAPDEPLNLVVVMPHDLQCATADVYARFDALDQDGSDSKQDQFVSAAARVAADARGATLSPDRLFNDLDRPAYHLLPELEQVRRAIMEMAETTVHLTGSGAAMFMICDDRLHAEFLAAAITKQHGHPAWAVRAATDLPSAR
ncbi:MAG: 4-(cytidine 5'-diphospho)-2-C-methyl-D-erythritol kinase [Planctomycetes bacterium]|nr:4-(cytidine 5'-diphospho)-2-C-methyl-D-erythritol kinase [Planctomycetota bacterium]NOG54317.1 4-(cytidine 5'-diphospho)-2-C-methyl-D-erythritol kinase [Planctomycetota bacterium]